MPTHRAACGALPGSPPGGSARTHEKCSHTRTHWPSGRRCRRPPRTDSSPGGGIASAAASARRRPTRRAAARCPASLQRAGRVRCTAFAPRETVSVAGVRE
eukprot:1592770-Prymnesium_polylepis.1